MRRVLRMMIGAALAAAPLVPLTTAAPALASNTGSTPTTFTVASGTLSISVPAAASLGSAPQGTAELVADLGNVTVIDARGSVSGSWTTTASTTPFITGAGTPAETIPASDVNYNAGPPDFTSGTGTFTPAGAVALASPQVVFTATGEVGNTTCVWNPTITVSLPPAVVAGAYSGTITHSVA